MTTLQFRVLYREFLFRMVDLEVLSAHALGDSGKLLGQFAAFLIFLSIGLSLVALGGGHKPPLELLYIHWRAEHSLIAITMLIVGIFAVLSWDSTFPDRRDVLVLSPLPVRGSTLFLAKVAAAGAGLCITVVSLHALSGLVGPMGLGNAAVRLPDSILVPASEGLFGLLRRLAAFWIVMLAAGAFVFCCILGLQGLAAQLLPRRIFLRISSFLQMGSFALFLSVFLMQPSASPAAIAAAQRSGALSWSPSYWFLGLYQQLIGSPALAPLAHRAWLGLAIGSVGTTVAYGLSYVRSMRQIAEQPDLAPAIRGGNWLPRFGNALQTAIVHFSVRTLLRSRQHRMILAFYLGLGFALTILLLHDRSVIRQNLAHRVSVPLLLASILMLAFAIVGTRVIFVLPLDLRANWVFRITAVPGGRPCLVATRRALLLLSVAPVWLVTAAFCFALWPWWAATGHLLALGLVGLILAEISLVGFQKIPFTCSYLPGKSQFHMAILGGLGVLNLTAVSVGYERQALERPALMVAVLATLAALAAVARWGTAARANSRELVVQFEEEPRDSVITLGLCRDGFLK